MRREFRLSEADEQFLDGTGLDWEALREPSGLRVLVHRFRVPTGYNVQSTSLCVELSPGYPDAQLDMMYFLPHLARLDGKALGAVSTGFRFDGRDWQRWSRHRTGQNPWRPGVDSLATHVLLVAEWLEREFR